MNKAYSSALTFDETWLSLELRNMRVIATVERQQARHQAEAQAIRERLDDIEAALAHLQTTQR